MKNDINRMKMYNENDVHWTKPAAAAISTFWKAGRYRNEWLSLQGVDRVAFLGNVNHENHPAEWFKHRIVLLLAHFLAEKDRNLIQAAWIKLFQRWTNQPTVACKCNHHHQLTAGLAVSWSTVHSETLCVGKTNAPDLKPLNLDTW